MSVATVILLVGYLAVAVYALLSPSDDPQRGMANGFIIFVALILLTLAPLSGSESRAIIPGSYAAYSS